MEIVVVGREKNSRMKQFFCKHHWRNMQFSLKVDWKRDSRTNLNMPILSEGRVCTKCRKEKRFNIKTKGD